VKSVRLYTSVVKLPKVVSEPHSILYFFPLESVSVVPSTDGHKAVGDGEVELSDIDKLEAALSAVVLAIELAVLDAVSTRDARMAAATFSLGVVLKNSCLKKQPPSK